MAADSVPSMAPCRPDSTLGARPLAISLDPRKAHQTRLHGDILAIYTWVNDERAMVPIPALRAPGFPWFIVCESADGSTTTHYLARQAAKAAEVLGMTRDDIIPGIASPPLIHEGLPDLDPHAVPPQEAKLGPSGKCTSSRMARSLPAT